MSDAKPMLDGAVREYRRWFTEGWGASSQSSRADTLALLDTIDARAAEGMALVAAKNDEILTLRADLREAVGERDRLREALRRGVQAVEHNERGDVRIDGRWTERDCIVSEMRAALAKVKP